MIRLTWGWWRVWDDKFEWVNIMWDCEIWWDDESGKILRDYDDEIKDDDDRDENERMLRWGWWWWARDESLCPGVARVSQVLSRPASRRGDIQCQQQTWKLSVLLVNNIIHFSLKRLRRKAWCEIIKLMLKTEDNSKIPKECKAWKCCYPPVLAGSGQAACDRTCFLQTQAAPGRARQGRDPLVSVSH